MMMNEWTQFQQPPQNYLNTKLEESFDVKNYHYDPYYQQQFAAAASQYSNICQPQHNFDYSSINSS